jgi:hypothetical protein
MMGESKIKEVLEHLAWLKEQARAEINHDRAYDAALLTYNAAVMLQWHFVMPASDTDQIQSEADRKMAAKLIDDFVWAVKAVFEKAETAKNSRPAETEILQLSMKSLKRLIAKILQKLPPLFAIETVTPIRFRELERTQDYAKHLRDWVSHHPRSYTTDRGPLAASLRDSDGGGLRRSLAAALAAQDATAMTSCPPHIRRAFRETIAGFVEFDAEETAGRSHGTGKKRWSELGKSLAQHLRAAGGRAS